MSVRRPSRAPASFRGIGTFEGAANGHLIGYKVMRHAGKADLTSGADSRIRLPMTRGAVHRMPGQGIFLGSTKQYVLDHYGVFERNALLTYTFDPKDLRFGSLTDREPEIAVSQARLVDFELLDEDLNPLATRPNPSEFWGSEGAGVLPMARSTGRVLLGLRSGAVRESDTWGIFGGAFRGVSGEDDELVAAEAALREFHEETGWDHRSGRSEITPLLVFERPGFRYHNFLLVLPRQFTPELNWEHDDAAWFDLDDLPSPLHFGLEELLQDRESLRTIKGYARATGRPRRR